MDFFDKIKSGINRVKDSDGIPVPITADMLQRVLKRNEKLQEVVVEIKKGEIIVTGKAEADLKVAKKDVSFSITLQPVRMKGRELIFKIAKLKPLNLSILNKRIFDKPPHLTYQSGHIRIDFNSWDLVRKIPVGKIKSYQLGEGKIVVMVGV
ncbi:hypothetical protein [Sutcliffiella horikoshii]|uniref:DUF2993 domain-containing protein n=1 Tax=Sutcliffiella horikoshii TaxID=79883 RepID=A0A5D4TD51_9BACI|nr:hypothetical protein [Sutcliffiella horikoshii]TYS72442.1 hypothetical protein FZC75_10870 [Sutcliffiella horikoshii]